MDIINILYIITGVAIVVLTVAIVWLINESIGLIRSLRHSSEDAEAVTKEIREKVMMASEALDRVGTASSNLIGLLEDAVAAVKTKRDQIADGIGLITGVGKGIKENKSSSFDKTQDGSAEPKGEDDENDESDGEVKEKPKKDEKPEKESKPEAKKSEKPAKKTPIDAIGEKKEEDESLDEDSRDK